MLQIAEINILLMQTTALNARCIASLAPVNLPALLATPPSICTTTNATPCVPLITTQVPQATSASRVLVHVPPAIQALSAPLAHH